jgi:hypothetical protein
MTERSLSGYTCAYCPQEFATYRETNEHAKLAHPDQYVQGDPGQGDGEILGPDLSQRVDEYARHMRTAIGPMPSIEKAFARLDTRPTQHAPLSPRTHIAAMAMSALLGRVDGKLPVQVVDQNNWVAGAASLAVKAADALLKELDK